MINEINTFQEIKSVKTKIAKLRIEIRDQRQVVGYSEIDKMRDSAQMLLSSMKGREENLLKTLEVLLSDKIVKLKKENSSKQCLEFLEKRKETVHFEMLELLKSRQY